MDNQNKTKQKQQVIDTKYESPLSFYVMLSLITIFITLIQVSASSLATLSFSLTPKPLEGKTERKESSLVSPSNNSNNNPDNSNPPKNSPRNSPKDSDTQNFQKAMIPILKFEGTCSDDPYDSGGRTYMGITTRVARRNGYRGDVCNMPKSQVYAIYKKDYWDILPVNLAYPEKLALFNITINGSSRRCKSKSTAEAMLDCQQKYYESLRVFWRFGKGWTRRNNYFISLIQELRRKGY
jgi:hypothetical protein